MNGVAEIVNGVEDHVHILASLRPIHCVADLMRDLKKDSTNWVKEILTEDSPGRKVMRSLPLAQKQPLRCETISPDSRCIMRDIRSLMN